MKQRAFTLIELLAVIIILGILMLIAIPSVTSYINNSRKETYIDTIKELVKGTVARVNSGELEMYDPDTTYYVPCTCIKLENGEAKSPYGKFDPAYIVITYDGDNYNYYFTGKDVEKLGIPTITKIELLSKERIVGNIDSINTSVGITGTSKIEVFNSNCSSIIESKPALTTVSGNEEQSQGNNTPNKCTGDECICKRATQLHSSYGSLGTEGSLNVGDAFDCDVNGDGTYNSETERFYYISDYYDTEEKDFNSDYAVLVFYNNVSNGNPSNSTTYKYHSEYNNHDGSDTGIYQLPSNTKWGNVSLYKTTRALLTKEGNNSFQYSGTINLNQNIDYSSYSSRFLIWQEIEFGCNHSNLSSCSFLLENIGFANYGNCGYWIDTPQTTNGYDVYGVNHGESISANYAPKTGQYGVRPVIELPKTSISY